MNYDIIVLGSGPGGYVAAIRASQLGLKTAIVERESLGGICLNWGCIPTKALLKSANVFEYLTHASDYGITVKDAKADFGAMIERSRGVASGMSSGIQFLMKKNKIDVLKGTGTVKPGKKLLVKGDDGKSTEYTADKGIIIATGARSRVLPNLPQDGQKIIGYREAMTLKSQPKKLVVVGSGAIGVEFAYFYNAIGTEVTIVEFMPNIVPIEDVDVSKRRKIDDFPLCFHCHKLGHLIDSYWMKYPNKKRAFNSKKDGPSQPTLSLNAISLPPPSKQCFRKLLITCLLWPPKRLEKFGN
jgi:dihydrolipoamide dehydrogenase